MFGKGCWRQRLRYVPSPVLLCYQLFSVSDKPVGERGGVWKTQLRILGDNHFLSLGKKGCHWRLLDLLSLQVTYEPTLVQAENTSNHPGSNVLWSPKILSQTIVPLDQLAASLCMQPEGPTDSKKGQGTSLFDQIALGTNGTYERKHQATITRNKTPMSGTRSTC